REEVRPAAAVEEHDRLLAPAADLLERVARARVQHPGGLERADQLDRRQRPSVDPRRERDALERGPALGTRRGGADDQSRTRVPRAALGHQPGVVARIALLL